jgi:hypothetical protein
MPKIRKRKSNLQVRFLQPDEIPLLKSWRKLHKEVDEFVYLWTRYKNWEANPPVVALMGGTICGFHGVSFAGPKPKWRYINSMAQFVLEEFRGKRIAGAMIDFILKEGDKRSMHRLRFRCPIGGEGMDCWMGFGVKPFAQCEKDYWFDIDIVGVDSVKELIRLASELSNFMIPTEDNRRISYYRKSGLKILTPSWKGVF